MHGLALLSSGTGSLFWLCRLCRMMAVASKRAISFTGGRVDESSSMVVLCCDGCPFILQTFINLHHGVFAGKTGEMTFVVFVMRSY